MPSLKVAHIREQGQNMILVPLDSNFGYKSDREQSNIMFEIQDAARSAGLAGSVVAVWNAGGQTGFRGPAPWHPFLRSIGLNDVLRSVNKTISW